MFVADWNPFLFDFLKLSAWLREIYFGRLSLPEKMAG
jgi:hypothetical protein